MFRPIPSHHFAFCNPVIRINLKIIVTNTRNAIPNPSLSMLLYFAYGSNLHPYRLKARVPSAELLGMATLAGYRLNFHKQGADGSGKCNLQYTGQGQVIGALYRFPKHHKRILDNYESGYQTHPVTVTWEGNTLTSFTYIAHPGKINDNLKPYEWYRQMLILGGYYLEMPRHYLHAVTAVQSLDDPDKKRRLENEALLAKMDRMNKVKAGLKGW
ncbi:MAG: hypothetical protein AXA67_09470 [Methylothermaceae bacteria B42]|nr:MAG: hypothetical protein AXA67_09470 [Methylothermaceae bacteria B42]HHJ39533.1 gamma-glutamylcyclotransferase [Methylothermaceae bacterium]